MKEGNGRRKSTQDACPDTWQRGRVRWGQAQRRRAESRSWSLKEASRIQQGLFSRIKELCM